jgi:uncharacterized protein YrzB (UPF0473 family)
MLSQHTPAAAILGEASKLRLSAAVPRFGRLRKCGVFLMAPLAALVFNPDAQADDSDTAAPPVAKEAATEQKKPRSRYAERIAKFEEKHLVPFEQNGKFGYRLEWAELDGPRSGSPEAKTEVVIPAKFDHAGAFSEDLACVSIDGKTGFIDKTGKEIIPLQYGHAQHFSEGLVGVLDREKGNQWGFINKTGEKVIPANYDFVFPFSNGLALVVRDKKFGLVDKTGKEVLPTKYIEIKTSLGKDFPENWILVSGQNELSGVVDRTGKEILPCKYRRIRKFKEGLAAVDIDNRWGFVDEIGKEVIPPKYDFVGDFSEGFAIAGGDTLKKKSGSSVVTGFTGQGFINKKGEEVIPLIFSRVKSFYNGVAEVQLNGKTFSIGKPLDNRSLDVKGVIASQDTNTQPAPRARDRSTSRRSTFPAPRSEFPSRR